MDYGKVFSVIDEYSAEYLDLLEEACLIESPTALKEKVDEVARLLADKGASLGFSVDVYPIKNAGDVVTITMNPTAEGAPLTLSGHLDTVHPVGLFGTPAVRRDEENMYGPGVVDCKGGVVSALLAMAALAKCGFDKRPIRLIMQTDEENGSRSSGGATINYMCESSLGSTAFLNLEGHSKGKVVLTRKGIIRYLITVHGIATHSSTCGGGANAITEAAYKIIELEKMKDADGLTCNCGTISGGTVANTVAELCSFTADIRFATAEQAEEAHRTVARVTETVNVKGCHSEAEQLSFRPAMEPSEKNNALLDKMNAIYARLGLPVLEPHFGSGGSDAANLTVAGVPAVDCLGTEGGGIHSAREYMKLSSLASSAKRIAALAEI